MRRLAVLLALCAVTISFAAPAPLPRRPQATGPWSLGWDAPDDLDDGSALVRKGGVLAIQTPGFGPMPPRLGQKPRMPRTSRKVRGDFSLSVRVVTEGGAAVRGKRTAGLFVFSSEANAFVQSYEDCDEGSYFSHTEARDPRGGKGWLSRFARARPKETWLLLARRAGRLELATSTDGVRFDAIRLDEGEYPLDPEVEVGVFAAASAPGPFVARFDRLEFADSR